MTFSQLSPQWGKAFEAGWEAFRQGSIPIGAVIADRAGNILSVGRNRVFEAGLPNPKIAHAEVEALRALDTAAHPDVKNYTLYATMEPCPMCMGTIVLANIRTLRYAARDRYAGAAHLLQTDRYMASKQIACTLEGGALEIVQLSMQLYFELCRWDGVAGVVAEQIAESSPISMRLARELYQTRRLHKLAEQGAAMADVFDEIVALAGNER